MSATVSSKPDPDKAREDKKEEKTNLILVVDDDVDLVESIATFLTARGFAVATAHNAKTAYGQIVKKRPDLMILDVMMDYAEEGMVFASALKSDGPTRDIPILMLSGFTATEATRQKVVASLLGQEWPVDMFVEKPVRLADLAERIEKLLKPSDGLLVQE